MENETHANNQSTDCSKLVALVLARDAGCAPLCVIPNEPGDTLCVCDSEGEPTPRPLQQFKGQSLVKRTVETLAQCGFAAIEVSANPIIDEEIEQELAGIPATRVSTFDASTCEARAAERAYFECFGLDSKTLYEAQFLAEDYDAEGVMVIPCDLANMQPRHIQRLVEQFNEHPEAEVIASWIAWLNRPPYILRTSFLQDLDGSPRCAAYNETGSRPLPNINAHEVVFGAEMLSAQPPASNPQDAFFAGCTLSALEAVRAVRKEQAIAAGAPAHNPADESALSKQLNAAFAGKAPVSTRSASDEMLLQCARDVLATLDAAKEALSAEQQSDLATWDAWARRNKTDFPLFGAREHAETLVYLDSAATSQRVGRALDAQYRYDAYENANVYRGAYKLSAQSTATFNEARATLERHLGAKRRSTIYTTNTTTAIALAASAWGEGNINADDRILVPENEHHSNILPWMMLAKRKGARLEFIPVQPDGRIDIAAYETMLSETPAPKLVSVAHITNVLGLVNPVQQMAELAHNVGARFFLDAAQSFAHLPVNVNEIGADFIAISAHKAYGPMGIGALWVSSEAFAEMEPRALGGGTVSHVAHDSYYMRDGAIAYELGTPAVSQSIGFAKAIDYLNELGMDAIEKHGAALTRYLVSALRTFEGVTIWGDHTQEDGLAGLVSFTQAGIPPKTVAAVLGALNVAIRAGGHCALPLHASMGLVGSIRFSIAVHTTVEDIEAGLVALELARRLYDVSL
ncbi:MAG: aminotransferase class V-fold PLP-dependent enzyme [Eggerthellaceae bacterium]|nr:aminotransferase class V-fold PLP-dependent enzyme [Eggerthellaceae bacterium]